MIFEINNKCVEVISEIEEYDDLIYGRFSQFQKVSQKTDNYLVFKKDKVEICIDNTYKILNNKVIKTDLYVIINNLLSYLIDDSMNVLMHSVVVSKNNKGILITGDFGQGKTTLAKEFEKQGYEFNSTDQTWIEINNKKLYLKLGSKFDIENNQIRMLETNEINKRIKIDIILKIQGLCDNGKVVCNEINNEYYKVKNLANFCNWSWSMPIFTDNVELFNLNKASKEFLINMAKADVHIIEIRGDKIKIIDSIKEKYKKC